MQIRLRPETEVAMAVECVAFIHQIFYRQIENEVTQVFLLASRYSFLGSFHPFSCAQLPKGNTNRKELLLHFTNFDTMGKEQDAEIIPISRIDEARKLEFEPASDAEPVQFSAHVPQGMNKSHLLTSHSLVKTINSILSRSRG